MIILAKFVGIYPIWVDFVKAKLLKLWRKKQYVIAVLSGLKKLH
jgi:hypothetical protein